ELGYDTNLGPALVNLPSATQDANFFAPKVLANGVYQADFTSFDFYDEGIANAATMTGDWVCVGVPSELGGGPGGGGSGWSTKVYLEEPNALGSGEASGARSIALEDDAHCLCGGDVPSTPMQGLGYIDTTTGNL